MDLSYSAFQNSQSQTQKKSLDLSYSAFQQTQNAEPKPGFFSRVGNAIFDNPFINKVRETGQAVAETLAQPLTNLMKPPEVESAAEAITSYKNKALDIAAVGAIPFTMPLAAARKIPALKPAAEAIDGLFEAIGVPGGFFGQTLARPINLIPDSVMSKETKHAIIETSKDFGTLATQIIFGEKILNAIATRGKPDIEKNKLEVQNMTPDEINVEIRKMRQLQIKNQTAKTIDITGKIETPYIPENQLPTIQAGKTPKNELPIIQTEPPPIKTGYTYEPIKPEIPATSEYMLKNLSFESYKQDMASKEAIPKESPIIPKIEGTGAKIESGFAKSAEARAITDKLATTFGELPTHNQVNIMEQYKAMDEIFKADPERVLRMAKNEEPTPPNIHPVTPITFMSEYARTTGNVAMMRDIAISEGAANVAHYFGVGVKLFDTGTKDNLNPVDIMRDVNKARQERAKTQNTKTIQEGVKLVDNVIKTEIAKAVSKRPTWEEFINKITCGIE